MLQALLLALAGGFLAIAGTVTGQYVQARNNQRDRMEEHSREDRYRLYRDRLDAYREYHVAVGGARRAMAMYSRSTEDVELRKALIEERVKVWRAYTLVWLIGEESVVDTATKLFNMVDRVTWESADFEPEAWRDGVRAFVEAARGDLFPENNLSIPS
jgi:hypothetical protein